MLELIGYFIFTLALGFFWLKLGKRMGIGEFCSLERFNDKVKGAFRKKEGTVTIGGIIILLGLWTFVLLNQKGIYFSIAGIASMLFIFGAFDDISKIMGKKGQGLSWMQKIALHFIVGALFCFIFYFNVSKSPGYFIFNALFFMFFVNALNIADGLDGLAIGNFIIVIGFLSYGFYSYGNTEMSRICLVIMALSIGFFVFNIFGKMFMGDAGAGMLGGILAMIAIFGKMKMLAFFAGMFFVADGLSSFIQVFGRRMLGRRLLAFACPVHHHFINKGVSERKIVILSWFFSLVMGVVGLILMKYFG